MMARVSILLVSVLLFLGAGDLTAQNQKIGYVNTDFLLSQLPEYDGIQQQLRIIGEDWKRQLDEMQEEIDRLEEDFEAREILYSESERNERREEIRFLIQQREQFLDDKFGPEGEYFQRQQELLQPIQQKVFDAIRQVADREAYDFVFDRARDQSLLFGRNEWNLNDAVLEQMGIIPDGTGN